MNNRLCLCGCGTPISNRGGKQWAAGHYNRRLCKCGCGEWATQGSKGCNLYKKGHYHRPAQEVEAVMLKVRSWRNSNYPPGTRNIFHGKYKDYWRIKLEDGGWDFEHRIVAEHYLGRKLTENEVVHHRNGDGLDNRIENIDVMDKRQHASMHNRLRAEFCAASSKKK